MARMNRATKILPLVRLLSLFFVLAGLNAMAFLATPLFAQDTVGQLSPAAQAIAQGINQQRVSNGLPVLTVHPLLDQAAQNHVDDMIANHFYGHAGSDGSYARQRVDRVGYNSGGWVSENWVTSNSPDSALNWWMSDWIHRVNILNPNWREVGVGVGVDPNGGTIFVTDFTAGSNGERPVDSGVVANTPIASEPLSVPTGGIDYAIQPGDTLLAIAYRYGLDWVVIAESNKLGEETLLQIGQVLHLPGVKSVGGPVADKSEPSEDNQPTAKAEAPTGNRTANGFTRSYTVQPGNTLVDIAGIYNISWEELAAANNLQEGSVLKIGQELSIPGEIPLAAAANAEAKNTDVKSDATNDVKAAEATSDVPQYYELQEGDTIISVAVHYHLDWDAVLRMNNLNEDSLLQLGQKIRLR